VVYQWICTGVRCEVDETVTAVQSTMTGAPTPGDTGSTPAVDTTHATTG